MISTRGRYAVRVMLDLAQQEPGLFVSLNDVAKRQSISKKYLEAIVHSLAEAQLVEGARGKNGGYRLTREPADYPIVEILEAAEGSLSPVACLKSDADPCELAEGCLTLPLWQRYYEIIREFFAKNTLQDVLDGTVAP